MNSLIVFHLIIYLLNENQIILSYDQIYFHSQQYYINQRYLVYLMSERSKFKFVRINSYIIKQTNVQYISSWFFNVSFPFLPVNRLAAELFLVNDSFKYPNCQKRCSIHGKCMFYINLKQREYCWCDENWFGDECQYKSSSNLCHSTSCSPYSQCVILNEEKKQRQCICPLGKSGDQCYITHNACSYIQCENNGTCLPFDMRNLGYICICTDEYDGIYCQTRRTYSYISIDINLTNLSSIPALISVSNDGFHGILSQSNRILHIDVTLPTTSGNVSIKRNKPDENPDIFEGDILFPNSFDRGLLLRGDFVAWPNGIVPYEIASGYDNETEQLLILTMKKMERLIAINNVQCIQFRPRISTDEYYIIIVNGDGCSSFVGRNPDYVMNRTVILQYPDCISEGHIMHELLHTLGFLHTQSRPDRDNYVKVYYDNIQTGMEFNFKKYDNMTSDTQNTMYDYTSVMHYDKYAFSKNGSPTILPLQQNVQIGQRYNMSTLDILSVRLFYNCSANGISKNTTVNLYSTSTKTSSSSSAKVLTSTTSNLFSWSFVVFSFSFEIFLMMLC